jgi:hypothetical protein
VLTDEQRSKIAKRSSAKGGEYERRVAKLIASYFGMDWGKAFLRTKRTTGGQPHGDLKPIDDMYIVWKGSGYGTIECKCRKEWGFNEIFKNPKKCTILDYWIKSRDDTKDAKTVVVFTKAGVTDYVMFPLLQDFVFHGAFASFEAEGQRFMITTLKDFLKFTWPNEPDHIQPGAETES